MGQELDLGNLGLENSNQDPSPQPDVETEPSYGNQFLTQVDESDRPIVEKYISEWDKGVTQKFQDLQGKLKPYEDLGVDFESVQAAIGVMQMAEQDPVGFFNSIKEQLEAMGLMDPSGENTNGEGSGTQTNLPEYEGLPPAVVAKLQAQDRQLAEFAKFKQDQESAAEKQTNEQRLDKLLKEMETKHGKFDQHAVLGRMMDGMSPEDAIKDYKKMMEGFSSPTRSTPPPVLGGGRTGVDQVDSSKLKDKKTRKAHVADMLAGLQD